jgi:hypothetical protein
VTTGTCARCDTSFELHGYHWCHQVCPACIQPQWIGTDGTMRADGFFWPADRERLARQIAADGGRYIPRFKD